MDTLRRKFPSIPPDIIYRYYRSCQTVEETVSLLETLYDKKKKKSYIRYDWPQKADQRDESQNLETLCDDIQKIDEKLSKETIRFIIEKCNYSRTKSIKSTKEIINAYNEFKSQTNPKVIELFEKLRDITNQIHIDELAFIIKINGSNLRSTVVSLEHYKRLNQIVDNFIENNHIFASNGDSSDEEWEVWDDDNDSDSDIWSDDEDSSILNPVSRLIYLFPIFDKEKIISVYNDEANKDYGLAYRKLRDQKVLVTMTEMYPSASNEEIRDAMAKCYGNEKIIAQIIQQNKIENPAPEEVLLALRNDLTINEAKNVISQAVDISDFHELLNISNKLYPVKDRHQEPNQLSLSKDMPSTASTPIKIEIGKKSPPMFSSFANIISQQEEIETRRKKQELILKPMMSKKKARENISTKSFGPILTLDLHGKRKADCKEFVEEVLMRNKNSRYSKINFITGKGKHSPGNIPVLRPLTMKICEKYGFKASILPDNDGVVQVELWDSN